MDFYNYVSVLVIWQVRKLYCLPTYALGMEIVTIVTGKSKILKTGPYISETHTANGRSS